MKRRLFSDEEELQSWSGLTLTTHRIIHHVAQHGFDASTSMLLEHVQWTRVSRVHQPLLPILSGGMIVLGGLSLAFSKGLAPILFIVGVVILLIYQATRRAALIVAAGGGRIEFAFQPSERSRQLARDFLDVVESAASRARAGRHGLSVSPVGAPATAGVAPYERTPPENAVRTV